MSELGRYDPKRVNNMFYEQQVQIAKLKGENKELEEERRMWFDRYAALWVSCDASNFTGYQKRMFIRWAAAVDKEYE